MAADPIPPVPPSTVIPVHTQGPPGPKGDKGDPGVAGPPGDTGPLGPQGPTGPSGSDGSLGPTGPQGPPGPQGVTGLQGDAGLTGPTGDVGPQGPIGPIGPQGTQGVQGNTGATGSVGPPGSQGPQGAQGVKGDKGDKGDQGVPGQDGIMHSVVAGAGISVNNADPANPIVTATVGLPPGGTMDRFLRGDGTWSDVLIAQNAFANLALESYGSNPGSILFGRAAAGSWAVPQPTPAGTPMMQFFGGSFGGSSYAYPASFALVTSQLQSQGARGAEIQFSTTPNNSTASAVRMIIQNTGVVEFKFPPTINGVAYDSGLMHLGLNETVTGQKTFANHVYISAATTETRELAIGQGRTADGISVIDLVGDAFYTDYGMRLRRDGGQNGGSWIQHRGTGTLLLEAIEQGNIAFKTDTRERMRISGASGTGNQIQIESYGAAATNLMLFRAAGGTAAAPTDTTNGMTIAKIDGRGASTAGGLTGSRVSMSLLAADTFSATAHGTRIVFAVTPRTTDQTFNAMTLSPSGSLALGDGNTEWVGDPQLFPENKASGGLWIYRSVTPRVVLRGISGAPQIVGARAGGTFSVPTATPVGVSMLDLYGSSFGGTTWAYPANITFWAAEQHSETARGTEILFYTTPKQTTGPLLALKIEASGVSDFQFAPTVEGVPITPAQSNRNKIINGKFDIWQRGASFSGNGSGYSADRWSHTIVGMTTPVINRSAYSVGDNSSLVNAKYYLGAGMAGNTDAAGHAFLLIQRVEDVRTFSDEETVISLRVFVPSPRAIAIEVQQFFGDGGGSAPVNGLAAVKIPLVAGWQTVTVPVFVPSIIGKTIGSTENDWIGLVIWLSAGTTFNARTGSLGPQTGNVFIGTVQWESGTVATPFEVRPVATELAMCQRYYFQQTLAAFIPISVGHMANATTSNHLIPLPATLRRLNTMNFFGTWQILQNGVAFNVIGFPNPIRQNNQIMFNCTVAGGLANGGTCLLFPNVADAGYYCDGEL